MLLLLPEERKSWGIPRNGPFAEKCGCLSGMLAFLLLSETKSAGLTPMLASSLCGELAAAAAPPMAKAMAAPGTGLRAGPLYCKAAS